MKKLRLLSPNIQATSSGPRLLDPVRKQLVPDGPEERVRQSVLFALVHEYGYPVSALASEELIARGTKNRDRADVLVQLPRSAASSNFRVIQPVEKRDARYSEMLRALKQRIGPLPAGARAITIPDELDVLVDGANLRCLTLGFVTIEGEGHALALRPLSPEGAPSGLPPILGVLVSGHGQTAEERAFADRLEISPCDWNEEASLELAHAISADGTPDECIAIESTTLAANPMTGALLLYGARTDVFGVLVEVDLEMVEDTGGAAGGAGDAAEAAPPASAPVSGSSRERSVGLATVVVIECKAPQVSVGQAVVEQAERYASALGASFVVVTNGHSSRVLHRLADGSTVEVSDLPDYAEVIGDAAGELEAAPVEQPCPFLPDDAATRPDVVRFHRRYRNERIGFATNVALWLPILSLDDAIRGASAIPGLPFERHGVRFLEDLGVNSRSPGSATGAGWPGIYRDILIETESAGRLVLGISLQGGWDVVDRRRAQGRLRRSADSYLLVSTANDREYEMMLQLNLHRGLVRDGSGWELRHDGRLTAGKGSVKRVVLFDALAARAPGLLENGLVRLGHLAGRPPIDAEALHEILGRLAAYVMVRRTVKRSVKAERGRSGR